uniref:Uncharacterized protein n=1 Tax=Anguilla anguilla TaxID=7936 RepID=A0A0E9W683_ANGAN
MMYKFISTQHHPTKLNGLLCYASTKQNHTLKKSSTLALVQSILH